MCRPPGILTIARRRTARLVSTANGTAERACDFSPLRIWLATATADLLALASDFLAFST